MEEWSGEEGMRHIQSSREAISAVEREVDPLEVEGLTLKQPIYCPKVFGGGSDAICLLTSAKRM